MNKNILAIGIIILFILSALAPITFGSNIKSTNENELSPAVTSNGGLQDSAWPMFQHDVKHTGQSPYGKSGTWWKEKWKVKIGDWADSSPVIDKNGTIYIGADGRLFAYYPNGTKKWGFKANDDVQSSPAIATDGTLYFGSNDGKLYAVYPNGTKKWDYFTDYYIFSSPALDNDTVYCGSYDGYMYAIYTSNGTLKWRFRSGDWVVTPAIGKDGTIYFGDDFRSLYAVNPNGTKKWHREDLGLDISSSPAIAEDGTIYVTATRTPFWGGYLHSIKPDGKINWSYFIDTEPICASPVIDKNGIIYFGGKDGIFYAVNPDGTLRWNYKSLDFILHAATIGEDGTIYFGATYTSEPNFYANLYAIEPFENAPPEKPSIDGPVNGKIKTEYTYTALTTDSDGDNVSYFFDWGDGTNSGWTEFVYSGFTMSRSHIWTKRGNYTVKVKAKDIYGMEGDWETLTVTMPRNKAIANSLFLRFLEWFPMLERLLNYLIK